MSIPLFDMCVFISLCMHFSLSLSLSVCVCVHVARVTVKCPAFPPSVVDWCDRNHLYHYHYDRTMREREGVRGGVGRGRSVHKENTESEVWFTAK